MHTLLMFLQMCTLFKRVSTAINRASIRSQAQVAIINVTPQSIGETKYLSTVWTGVRPCRSPMPSLRMLLQIRLFRERTSTIFTSEILLLLMHDAAMFPQGSRFSKDASTLITRYGRPASSPLLVGTVRDKRLVIHSP
jgi:hypothetical protein